MTNKILFSIFLLIGFYFINSWVNIDASVQEAHSAMGQVNSTNEEYIKSQYVLSNTRSFYIVLTFLTFFVLLFYIWKDQILFLFNKLINK